MFVLVILNKSDKLARAIAHFKTMTQARPVSGFDIFWVHNQDYFIWFCWE